MKYEVIYKQDRIEIVKDVTHTFIDGSVIVLVTGDADCNYFNIDEIQSIAIAKD